MIGVGVRSLLPALLLLGALLGAGGAGAAKLPPLDGDALSREGFTPYVGEAFRVYGGDGDRGAHKVETLTLVKVEDSGSSKEVEQFLLRFRGAVDAGLRSTSYTFEHANGSLIRLFIEPDGADGKGSYFAARFSQLKGGGAGVPKPPGVK